MRRFVSIAVFLILVIASVSITGEERMRKADDTRHLPAPVIPEGLSDGIDDAAHFKYYQNDSGIINWREWWYANVKGDDGNNLLVEFFTFGNLNNPVASAVGVVMILMKSDGSTFKSLKSYPFIDYSLDYDKCDVRVAGDRFLEHGDGSYTVTYHNNINDVSMEMNIYTANRGIEAIPAQADTGEWMRWIIPIPYGRVDGTLEYTDRDGHHVYELEGRGYHDHNWGIFRMFALEWDWGEFTDRTDNASITYGMVKFGDKPLEGGIYFSDENSTGAVYMPDLSIEYLKWEKICGFKKPTEIRMYGSNGSFSADVTVKLDRAYLIGVGSVGMPYLLGRMSGEVFMDGRKYTFSDVTGFYEHHFLNPFG